MANGEQALGQDVQSAEEREDRQNGAPDGQRGAEVEGRSIFHVSNAVVDKRQVDGRKNNRDPPVLFGQFDFVFEIELTLEPVDERRTRTPVLDLERTILGVHLERVREETTAGFSLAEDFALFRFQPNNLFYFET